VIVNPDEVSLWDSDCNPAPRSKRMTFLYTGSAQRVQKAPSF
jgi:hypothetical protein